MSFWFGLIVGFGGFFGLTLGSALSYFLRPRIRWVDPVICGVGLLLSVPFTLPAIGRAKEDVVLAFVLMALDVKEWNQRAHGSIYKPSRITKYF